MIERNAGNGLNEASECHMLFPVRKMVFLCVAKHRAVILDVADSAEILGLADTGVARLGVAQLARKANWRSSSID